MINGIALPQGAGVLAAVAGVDDHGNAGNGILLDGCRRRSWRWCDGFGNRLVSRLSAGAKGRVR